MTKRFSRIGWVVIALALVLAALGSVAPLPASAAPSPQGVTPGTVVTLAGTPHIWIADDQGVLHWNGDTRALATQFVNWGSRLTMSLGQLQGMRRGDRWLSAGLLKDGDPIYLVKWESNESVPRLLHIQSIRDVEQFGIKRSNHGSFVIDRMAWEQQFGISASSLPRGVLTSAVQRPSVVALTDAWEENGLVLSINGTPHGCCWSWGDPDLVALSFTLENKTSSTLNFEVPLRSFS
ncbi:MAG: hypothetical protein ACRDI2_18645, partial [Chloroflexota bacterium]